MYCYLLSKKPSRLSVLFRDKESMPSQLAWLVGFSFAFYLALRPTDKLAPREYSKDSLDRDQRIATTCFESVVGTLKNRTTSNQDLNYFMHCLVIETGQAEPSLLTKIDIPEVHRHIVDFRRNVEQGECASK